MRPSALYKSFSSSSCSSNSWPHLGHVITSNLDDTADITRCHILQLLNDTIPLYNMICQQSAMFIKRCLHSDSPVVKHVARHGVFYGRMAS